MSIFLSLLAKLFPLYLTMGAGFALARWSGGGAQGLARIQIYLIAPVVLFTNMLRLEMAPGLWLLPLIWFLFVASLSSVASWAGRWKKSPYTPVLAQASGGANTGYLGVPVALALFPADWLPVYFFIMVGGLFYESTLGYYWIARGQFSVRDSLRGILRLPIFYALILGLLANGLGLTIPEAWDGVARDFIGAYVVLGALIIGVSLGQNKRIVLAPGFTGALLGVKFVVWPLAMFGIVSAIGSFWPDVPVAATHSLLLMSIMPLAANSAAFAALLDLYAEETATAVALSTLLSLVVVPFYVVLFGLAG